jgi:tripartite-type tricarboxylate transporter receptor subunit TctC
VSLVALVPSALTASINNPANTLKEVIDIEKNKPGTFQVGVSTPTSQVAIGLLNMMAGTNMVIVPYRGGTTQITSMMAGDIPLGHESVNVALPLYRAQKIKIIALTGQKRLALAPEIPLVAETFPGFELRGFLAVAVPKAVPDVIKSRINELVNEAILSPAINKRLVEEFNLVPRRMDLVQCAAYDHGERERWAKYIKIAKIEPQ